jgi:hypothetical protein
MLIHLYSYKELVEYPKIIKNTKKENNMTMQSMDWFCSYKKVW